MGMRVHIEDTYDGYRVSWYWSASRRAAAEDPRKDRKSLSSCQSSDFNLSARRSCQDCESDVATPYGGLKTHLLQGVFCLQVHTPGVQEMELSLHQPFTVGVHARLPAPGPAAIATAAVGKDKGFVRKGVGVRVLLGSGESHNSMAGKAAQQRSHCNCLAPRTTQ